MRAAPGGQLPLAEIHGRDRFVADLWRTLDGASVRLEAERRIGKTHVLNLMEGRPADGWEVIKLDLEEVHSADEFAERVCTRVRERLTGWKRSGRRLESFLREHGGGGKLGPVSFPKSAQRPVGYWKSLLTGSVEDLVEQQAAVGKRVVFLFDELPWMISAIAERSSNGARTAMEVLDVLRRLRQSTPTGAGFRMVLCGSIGMHHALADLRRAGYRNQPVNDMVLVELPPLDDADAAELARRLLSGEGLEAAPQTAARLASAAGGFPFYIHWIVSRLRSDGRAHPVTPADVDDVVQWLLTTPHDPCSFQHLRARIDTYYPGRQPAALALLDHAAAADGPLDEHELINVGRTAGDVDDETLRELLRLLSVDHYLERGTDGRYRFRHALLQRWWRLSRGLTRSDPS